MKLLNSRLLSLVTALFFTSGMQFIYCGSSMELKKPNTINVNFQKISLQPFKGWEKITSSEYWPNKESVDELLIHYIQQVWKSLYTEFRLCEKYGFYKMVDSTELNTVEISLKILTSEFHNDTLYMPIEMSTHQKTANRMYYAEINAFGILPGSSEPSVKLSIQDLVAVFDDYKRRFPYKKAVAPYYLKENRGK
ncbi:MAG: hypothetical protein PVI26_09760 [Chitinispirillia bacterium]|jgi:hypothetical protein